MLKSIKNKYKAMSAIGLSYMVNIAYGADLSPIQTIIQFILKAGG